MTKEMTVKESALPAAISDSNWGAIEGLDANDLLIPKIFHQQSTSKFAKDGLAKVGDWCDNLTGDVLAKKDEDLEVIIFGVFKTMVISKKPLGQGKFKLDKIVTITPENAMDWIDKPFIEEIHGDSIKYSLTYNFYCLLPSKVKELPYVLSLASTKVKTAKKINTFLLKLQQSKKPGASRVFNLKSIQQSNDQGDWFGIDVSPGRESTTEELMRAHAWYLKSKTQKFVTQEEGSEDVEDIDGANI